MIEKHRYYTIREAATILGWTEVKLRRRIERGQGPIVSRSGQRAKDILGQDLLGWIEKNRQRSSHQRAQVVLTRAFEALRDLVPCAR